MEEDDDELAQLRAARRARLGAAGATLSERRQGGAAPSHDSYFEEEENPRRDGNGRQERAGDEAEDDGLRAMLPMSFGGEKLRGKPVTAEDGDDPSSRAGSTGRAAAVPTSYGPPRPETLPKEAGEQRAEEEDEDSEEVGPRPPDAAAGGEADKGEDEGSDEEDDVRGSGGGGEGGGMGSSSAAEADPYHLPVTQEVELAGHSKVVAALDIDRTGSRLVTGGLDYQVRLYDFNGMKSDLKPFRDLEPSSGYPVLGLSWSPSGDAFLCVMGSTQAKLYDRDGRELGEFPRGDMYIRDMKNTKGHVASCRGGQWHPNDKTQVMTCSEDGTVRLWDAHQLTQRTVLKPKPGRKVQRTHVTSCCYNSDGRVVAAGLNDGSIQLWTVSGGRIGRSAAVGVVLPPKPQMIEKQRWTCKSEVETVVAKAHAPGGDITSLAFSRDNNLLLSRAEDSLKLWDLRNAQRGCVHEWTDLPLLQSSTACGFSPDESLLLTGTCADRSGVGGAVWFFDRARLSLVRKVAVPGSAVALKWHAGLNQILVGAGTNSVGGCRVLYDPVFSVNGALRCVGRKPRAKNPLDFEAPPVIHNPHALPLFREDPGRKRRRELDRKDPAVSRQPDPGDSLAGPGKGGRLGTTKKTLLTQHIMAKQGKLVSVEQEMDPRVALLRHADKTDEFSTYLTGAYGDTQPKKIFAEDEEDEEQPSGDTQK